MAKPPVATIKKKSGDVLKRQIRKGTNQSLPEESEQVTISEEVLPTNSRTLGGSIMESKVLLEELLQRQREEMAADVRALVKESEGLVQVKLQAILNKNDDFLGRISKSLVDMETANKQRWEALNKRLDALTSVLDQTKLSALPEPLPGSTSPIQSTVQTVVSKVEPAMQIETDLASPEVKPRLVGLLDPTVIQNHYPKQGPPGSRPRTGRPPFGPKNGRK